MEIHLNISFQVSEFKLPIW